MGMRQADRQISETITQNSRESIQTLTQKNQQTALTNSLIKLRQTVHQRRSRLRSIRLSHNDRPDVVLVAREK